MAKASGRSPAKLRPTEGSEARIRARNETKILRAAVELFARKGFDGTRVTEIAERCGLPKANVYYYFPSKGLIYERLIGQVLAGWDEALEHIVADEEPRAALTAYVTAKLEYSRTHTAESRFFANEMLRGGSFLSREQMRHMQDVTRERVAVLETWMAEGRMARVDPRHFFMLLWSATQFYADFETVVTATVERRALTRADYGKAAETILRTVLDGCLPDNQGDPEPPGRRGRTSVEQP